MAGASPLTVRANMRMVFDDQAADKAQANYMSRLAAMERSAVTQTSGLNDKLLQTHFNLTKRLAEDNMRADEKLIKDKKRVAENVAAAAKRAQEAIKPPKTFTKGGKLTAKYKKEEQAYKQATKNIAKHQKDMVSKMQKAGAVGLEGKDRISTESFLKQEAHIRKEIIELARHEAKMTERGTYERKIATAELKKFQMAQDSIAGHEHVNHQTKMKNLREERQGQKHTLSAMQANNRLLKERMALYHRINGAINSIQQQLVGGFQNAIMMSGVAIMGLGFKVQQLTADFIAFERELMNAQSIYQQSFDTLADLSDQIVTFGTNYGVALQDASEGLYTLASAGLSADDSLQVLTNTLKLSMAVQGDHDTIAKLTTQTLFGFNKPMADSAKLTDMFAHSINKSLIEYQDLASSVKFAMPFFVATNQEVEQLLGALQVLSNRALEAGIAGRGLRQTLAEFAQHAEDNTAAFRKLGIELINEEGTFKDLTEIAMEFNQAFPDINDNVDLMTTLLEDLNVRGATAFVHLVREAKGFQTAVDDLENSTGAATDMANIQQQSLANQIQVIKNSLMAPFLLSDKLGREGKTLNTFGAQLEDITSKFENLFIKKTTEGTAKLTKFGEEIRDSVIMLLKELSEVAISLLSVLKDMNGETNTFQALIHILIMPIKVLSKAMELFGDGVLHAYIMFRLLNIGMVGAQAATIAMTQATYQQQKALIIRSQAAATGNVLLGQQAHIMIRNTMIQRQMIATQMGSNLLMFAGLALISKSNEAYHKFGYILLFIAGAMMAVAMANMVMRESLKFGSAGFYGAIAAGGIAMVGVGAMMKSLTTPPPLKIPEPQVADLGMRMYDMGGIAGRHFPVMVEPGETIIPKTQNMLSGGSGITLNIQGDIVTNDADDFAERIAQALPEALRMQNDIGGI